MQRIRVYDSRKEYCRFNSKNSWSVVWPKTMKVSGYPTKEDNVKKYISGRLFFPSKFCRKFALLERKYLLSYIGKTHLVTKVNDLWGSSYLLLFFEDVERTGVLRFHALDSDSKNIREKPSSVKKDVRFVNEKAYTFGKIYLPEKLVNKDIHFIWMQRPIRLNFRRGRSMEKLYGQGCVLFYKNDLERKPVSGDVKIRIPAYQSTLSSLQKGKTIKQIAKETGKEPTSIWNQIAIAIKKNAVHPDIVKDIVMKNCNKSVREKVIFVLEAQANKRMEKERETDYDSKKQYVPVKMGWGRREMQSLVFNEHKVRLPINMIEVICLLLYPSERIDEKDHGSLRDIN